MARDGEYARVNPAHLQVLRLVARAPHGRADGQLIARFTTDIFELSLLSS
jgi:hypothetical protein